MTSSNANPDSTQHYYIDGNWVIHICDTLSAAEPDLENPRTVCICVVPESLSYSKRESFIPQFVGLGPYHHFRADLIITEQNKLAAAKRVLKDLLPADMNQFQQRISNFGSDIHTFYHPDAKSTYKDHTLSLLLAVDGLFLLAFIMLRTTSGDPDANFSNFFTDGNLLRMLLFNAAGVELTRNVLIREVFMLENQIPFQVLEQITDKGLGSEVVNFCKKHCPVLVKLQVSPNDTVHLLDLMYRLIVPRSPARLQPSRSEAQEAEPSQPMAEFALWFVGEGWEYKILLVPLVLCIIPNYIFVAIVYLIVKQSLRLPDSEFFDWEKVGLALGLYPVLLGYSALLILNLLIVVISSLFWLLTWPFSYFFGLVKRAFRQRNSLLRWLHDGLSDMEGGVNNPLMRSLTQAVANLNEITERRKQTSTDSANEGAHPQAERIPSAMQLHNAGISFQPSKSGIITSIDFDDEECIFYLPTIRLDENSEVIIRNLVAYETLIKSNTPLVFTRYVELMRDIIVTPEDVKLLVDNEIINTELWYVKVAELFRGMSKSIRPTMTPDLEKVIRKVNAKFDTAQKRSWVFVVIDYMSGSIFFTVMGCLLFLAFTALQTYCTVFTCFGTSKHA